MENLDVETGASHGRPEQRAHSMDPDETQDYEYEEMPDGESIRILTIEPGMLDDPLRGTLEVVNVNSPGSYEPMSYVWGQLEFVYEILIDNGSIERPVKLTPSLFEALRRLRRPDRRRRVWADQICINQKDLKERSQQVQFMNWIYKNASHVLVWLGVDDGGLAESAFSFVHELDAIFQDEEQRHKFHVTHTEELEKQSADAWKALDDLTRLPYFRRGWIVQEIGTNAPATMFWGEAKIEWTVLHRLCERLTDYHHLRSTFNIRTSDIKYIFQRFVEPDMESHHANRVNFIYELHRARGLDFTDDRDRIFAWLGHYSIPFANKELAALEANYEKTVAQVYTDVAKRALLGEAENRDGSALITLAAVQHSSLSSHHYAKGQNGGGLRDADKDTLPSWVPDWRQYKSFILSEPVNPHRAHGASSPKLKVDESGLLRIHGLEVDEVEACSRPLSAKEFHGPKHRGDTELAIQYIWSNICQRKQFNFDDQYINGQESLFACMQTLSNGCVQITAREKQSYHQTPRSRWLGDEALYLVKVLGTSDLLAPEVRILAEKTSSAGHREEQWSRSTNGASRNRKFGRTRKGYYVLGPQVMEKGDVVCVLFGGKLPFCLRPQGHRYLLVGECYVHGLMDGEAMEMMKREELKEKCFDIE